MGTAGSKIVHVVSFQGNNLLFFLEFEIVPSVNIKIRVSCDFMMCCLVSLHQSTLHHMSTDRNCTVCSGSTCVYIDILWHLITSKIEQRIDGRPIR